MSHTVSMRSTKRWHWGTFDLKIGVDNGAQTITDEQRDAFQLVDWFVGKLAERWDGDRSAADLMAALERAGRED